MGIRMSNSWHILEDKKRKNVSRFFFFFFLLLLLFVMSWAPRGLEVSRARVCAPFLSPRASRVDKDVWRKLCYLPLL